MACTLQPSGGACVRSRPLTVRIGAQSTVWRLLQVRANPERHIRLGDRDAGVHTLIATIGTLIATIGALIATIGTRIAIAIIKLPPCHRLAICRAHAERCVHMCVRA